MSGGGKRGVDGAFKIWWALPTLEISDGEGRQIIEVVWMINDKKRNWLRFQSGVSHVSSCGNSRYVRINDNLMISDNLNQ